MALRCDGGDVQPPLHEVERLDLETGQRRVVRELSPEGVSAVMLYVAGWVDDGRWYAYNYTMLLSTLFVVSNGR